MSGPGTQALEYGGRVDFTRLRAERHARLLRAVREEQLDALVLGREANARYASGARRLWTAGSRPFGPGCVLLAETDVARRSVLGSVQGLSDDTIQVEKY